MFETRRRNLLTGLVLLLFLAAQAGTAAAQVQSDAVLRDFVPNGEFLLEVNGVDLLDAEIYFSQRAVAYLILSKDFELPLMVSLRTGAVESISLMKLVKKQDGTVDILADAALDSVARFELQNQEVVWTVGDKQAKLKQRPYVLGRHSSSGVVSYDPSYAHQASLYAPQPAVLERLRAVHGNVQVIAFFGSWSPTCKRMLPNLLAVAEGLEGSAIHFEYYGLPQEMATDAEAERYGIHGVPTIVVLVDGQEKGRLTAGELESPETSLSRILGV